MFKKFLFIMTGVLLTAASTTNASYVVGYRIPVNSAADSLNIIIEAASTKTNYNYYVSETANNECHWQLGFSQNSVWTLEQTDATHYYIRNLASGRYIGPCPKTSGSTAKTVEEKADAAMFVFYSQATSPTSWTDYDNQTRFPRGWDDSSWMIYDTSASYAWRNDAGAQAAGNLYYGNGSHICMWNVYTAVEREETIPTADVFDMQFGANGAATDLSTMHNTIVKNGNVETYYNSRYGCYAARFNNDYGGGTSAFYKVNYAASSTDGKMLAALRDGHTLESVFCTRVAVEDKEAKWFSSHQQGGTGFLICKKNNGRLNRNEITFLPNVGGYKWATSGVQPEVDEFYHVVGVWDKVAGKARIYVNGELKNEVAAAGNLTLSGNDIYHWFGIGADPSAANSANSSGSWDIISCKIYDDALTTNQVDLLYKDLINRTGRKALREYINKVQATIAIAKNEDLTDQQAEYLSALAKSQEAVESDTIDGSQYLALEQQLRSAYANMVLLTEYVYPDGYIVTDSCFFPIHSTQLQESDVLTLATDDGTAATDTLAKIDRGGRIALPDGFSSGTYTVSLTRGNVTQRLGKSTLIKRDTMLTTPAQVVAHRGWWTKGSGTSQNSRAAVRNAFEAGFYGCEIDVHQTTDGHIMVNHDFGIGGVTINQSTYDQVKDKTLSNGEKIPQLSDFFTIMKDEYPDSPTKLVIELKVNANTDTLTLANSVVQAVKDAGLQNRVEYISYGVSACRYIRAADPTSVVASLTIIDIDKAKDYDLQGLDYNNAQTTQAMIDHAHRLGLFMDVYTIDNSTTMIKFCNMGADFITTNTPDVAAQVRDLYLDMMPESVAPDDPTAINSVELVAPGIESYQQVSGTSSQNDQGASLYDLQGRRISGPQRGLNIVHHTDGTISKVVVR